MDTFKISNRNGEISRLFKLSCSKARSYVSGVRSDISYSNTSSSSSKLSIFFYEHSNLHVSPKFFDNVYSFMSYCTLRNIKLYPYIRDIIEKCGTCRLTEKEGTHDLIIRHDWQSLSNALRDKLEF